MPITFKLVGNVNSKALEIKTDISGTIKLSNIISIFESLGLSSNDFKDIRIVHNSHTLDSEEKSFIVNEKDNLIVFIFSTVREIREKLGFLFLKHATNLKDQLSESVSTSNNLSLQNFNQRNSDEQGNKEDDRETDKEVDKELQISIEDKEEEAVPELSEDIIKEMNKKTIKLFQDPDFCNLIKIYYLKPELITTFINFVSHGDIINMVLPKVTGEVKDFSESINILKSLGINATEEQMLESLTIFNGHLNLTLRSLLCQKTLV